MTTVRRLITTALRNLGVTSANSVPTEEDVDISLIAFNSLIDSLSNNILNIHTINPYRFPMEAGKDTYTLGPEFDVDGNLTGADWLIERPMRIEEAVLLVYANQPHNCAYIQSFTDIDTISQWHFNETDGIIRNSAPGNLSHYDLNSNPTWSLDPEFGLCQGSANPSGTPPVSAYEFGATSSSYDISELFQQTVEVALYNTGEYSPGTGGILEWDLIYAQIFHSTTDAATIYVKVVRNADGDASLHFMNYQLSNTFLTLPFPEDHWLLLTWEVDVTLNSLLIYVNGQRVLQSTLSSIWPFYTLPTVTPDGSVFIYSGSGVMLDEFRQSDLIRYTGPEYDTLGDLDITENSSTLFLALTLLNYSQYASLTVRKLATNWPTSVYDNGGYPLRTLKFWPVPQDTLACELWLWQPLATYETLDDELNLPPGYERYLNLKLAKEVSPEFGAEWTQTLQAKLEEAENSIKTLNQMDTYVQQTALGRSVSHRTPQYVTNDGKYTRIPRVGNT